MILSKGGITIEVSHPLDIKRYKELGYKCPPVVEPEPEPEVAAPPVVEPEKVEKQSVKTSRVKEGKNG